MRGVRWKRKCIEWLGNVLRPGLSSRLFADGASLLLRIVGPRRRVALNNLCIAFPDISSGERRKLLKEHYQHLAWMAAEYFVLQRDPSQVLDWVVRIDGQEILDRYRNSGSGAVLLTAHFGNWELLAAWVAQKGYPLYAIVRDPEDPDDRDLIDTYRRRVGLKTIEKGESMMRVVSCLKRGNFVGILADQYGGGEGVVVPFFGKQTSTATGPALFAYLLGVPIIPIFSFRLEPFVHRIVIGEPLSWQKRGSREETLIEITRKVNEAFEGMIVQCPAQWLWIHRRWR